MLATSHANVVHRTRADCTQHEDGARVLPKASNLLSDLSQCVHGILDVLAKAQPKSVAIRLRKTAAAAQVQLHASNYLCPQVA